MDEKPRSLKPTDDSRIARARILLIDDEPLLVRAVRRMLERSDFAVVACSGGREALDAIERVGPSEFDLILCDMRMPEVDGPALHATLSTHHPHLAERMVFMTGDSDQGSHGAFLVTHAGPCLEKPFGRTGLLAIVESTLTNLNPHSDPH